LALYVLTIIGGGIFGSQAWEWKNFIKGEYGAIENKGGSLLQFVDKEGHRVALADFAVNLHEEREQLTQIKQSGLWEGSLPSFL
jgi:cytochrome c oxidase subunit 3